MAEAFPKGQTTAEPHPDDSKEAISILFLTTKWQFDTWDQNMIHILSGDDDSVIKSLGIVNPLTVYAISTCMRINT